MTMRRCRNCGGHVTPEFARVFGDNRDEIAGCLDCRSARELFRGAATGSATATE